MSSGTSSSASGMSTEADSVYIKLSFDVMTFSPAGPIYGRQIAGHIHGKNLDFLWIPYFNAYNWSQWAEYGFDKAWLQPNWLFNDRWQDRSHLYDACSMAA